jgi:hypothetical protein
VHASPQGNTPIGAASESAFGSLRRFARLSSGMGQRDDRHHHANRRRRTEKENGGRARTADGREERAPLAGYEDLYEISRDGRLFARQGRGVVVSGYQHSPVIRIAVNGAIVTLPKRRAVAESFAPIDAER